MLTNGFILYWGFVIFFFPWEGLFLEVYTTITVMKPMMTPMMKPT